MIANAAGRIQSYRHHEILYLQQMPSVDANARGKCSMLTRMAEQLRRERTMPGSCSSQVAPRKGAATRCLCRRDPTRQQSDINHVPTFFRAESRVDFDQLQSILTPREIHAYARIRTWCIHSSIQDEPYGLLSYSTYICLHYS